MLVLALLLGPGDLRPNTLLANLLGAVELVMLVVLTMCSPGTGLAAVRAALQDPSTDRPACGCPSTCLSLDCSQQIRHNSIQLCREPWHCRPKPARAPHSWMSPARNLSATCTGYFSACRRAPAACAGHGICTWSGPLEPRFLLWLFADFAEAV